MSYQSVVLADSPLRYYRLGETSGTVAVDRGSQAQNGTYNGGVTLAHPGLLVGDSDFSVLLDGTGYLSVPTTGLPTGASPWGVDFWINLTAGQPNGHAIMKLGDVSGQEVALYYTPGTGVVNLFTGTSHNSANNAAVVGTIYYFTVTYDGTTLILWINGANAVQVTITLNLTYGIAYIGNDDFAEPVQGAFDEAAFYATLSSAQITAHYHAGITAPQSQTLIRGHNRSRGHILEVESVYR